MKTPTSYENPKRVSGGQGQEKFLEAMQVLAARLAAQVYPELARRGKVPPNRRRRPRRDEENSLSSPERPRWNLIDGDPPPRFLKPGPVELAFSALDAKRQGMSNQEIGRRLAALLGLGVRDVDRKEQQRLDKLARSYIRTGESKETRTAALLRRGKDLEEYEREQYWSPEERRRRLAWYLREAILAWCQREQQRAATDFATDHHVDTRRSPSKSSPASDRPTRTKRAKARS